MAGMSYGGGAKMPTAPMGGGKPKDLASAIEASEPEVEMADDDGPDPEQQAILDEGGFSPEQGRALIRLIETML